MNMRFDWIKKISLYDYLIVAVVVPSFLLVLVPSWRESIQARIHKPYRKVLSVAAADILGNGKMMKVIKVASHEGISLEIYNLTDPERNPLVDRIELLDRIDGYFKFRGEAANLALDDLDGDSRLEILAPTYDESHRSHLNVFKFNTTTNKFEPYQR